MPACVDEQVFFLGGWGVSICLLRCVSPVCVPHPKQSEVTAHSGARAAAEPVLTHTDTQVKNQTEKHSLNKHYSQV